MLRAKLNCAQCTRIVNSQGHDNKQCDNEFTINWYIYYILNFNNNLYIFSGSQYLIYFLSRYICVSQTGWIGNDIIIIIYLIIKILIIDWSKLYHVTRLKSIYHCLEGLGVLSFDLRSNDSTPKPSDRTSNPSATFIIVASQLLQCRAALRLRYAHWFYFASSPFSALL